MRFLPFIALLTFALSMPSCTTTQYVIDPFAMIEPVPASQPIHVFDNKADLPVDAEEAGYINLRTERTAEDCNYDQTLDLLKQTSRKLGANIVLVTSVKPPTQDSCYRIKTLLYKAPQEGVASN